MEGPFHARHYPFGGGICPACVAIFLNFPLHPKVARASGTSMLLLISTFSLPLTQRVCTINSRPKPSRYIELSSNLPWFP